jgi:hypothetical protein
MEQKVRTDARSDLPLALANGRRMIFFLLGFSPTPGLKPELRSDIVSVA